MYACLHIVCILTLLQEQLSQGQQCEIWLEFPYFNNNKNTEIPNPGSSQ
jgi:hypothetical protein